MVERAHPGGLSVVVVACVVAGWLASPRARVFDDERLAAERAELQAITAQQAIDDEIRQLEAVARRIDERIRTLPEAPALPEEKRRVEERLAATRAAAARARRVACLCVAPECVADPLAPGCM